MKHSSASRSPICILAVLMVALLLAGDGFAETVIHQFQPTGGDGLIPIAGLTFWQGKLFGTTTDGGQFEAGSVFELTPPSSKGGKWSENVLYSFPATGLDAYHPQTGVVFDGQGNLYGATCSGGNFLEGAIYKLSPPVPPNTTWTESLIASFGKDIEDGICPSDLTFGLHGDLYGTTMEGGGSNQGGTVFQLKKSSDGSWTKNVLYEFTGTNGDGSQPFAGVVADQSGNLFGTTYYGGVASVGVLFELQTPNTPGASWTEKIIYTFQTGGTSDIANPSSRLIFDGAGNLYGVGDGGGTNGGVFQVSPVGDGTWTESLIYQFAGGSDGIGPHGSLLLDAAGHLYGTTAAGGVFNNFCISGCGTVFRLSSPSAPGGAWTKLTLYQFASHVHGQEDGDGPYNGVIFGPHGMLYGTAPGGPRYRPHGAVFSVHP